ncbi:nuclear receptor coactivator 5 [Aplysia californica]|uniref:Nuclear receptor coactivator 5 n=1 Tax=Aplysia californica TaxID=6500 RepID=A0ABM0JLS0_APLCA|nr:nuclear receptor coactivator 5 [Aplysia californica]
MSRPWLSDDVQIISDSRSRSRSRSGSRSKSKKTKVDQFGRSLPSRSRSRSGSRDRNPNKYRSDSRYQSRGSARGRSRSSRDSGPSGRGREGREGKRRRRSSSSSSGSDSSNASTHSRLVASSKPKYLNARLFVANIVSKEVTKDELAKHFEKYGNVVDILVHPKNYAFIQYLKEDHAKLAVEGENGSTLNGWRLDVKMANENRGRGGGVSRGGRGGRGRGGGWGGMDRDRSPRRDDPGMDPYGDPYGPPPGPRGPGPYPPPPPGDYGLRDPFYPDPYRRYPPEPWLPPHDDPYRRDPYADPYRDPYRAPAPPPPPVIECEIFLVNSKLRAFGEAVQVRIKDHNIITAISIIPEGRTAAQMTEELTTRKGLFAIFINPQNEVHRSLTLNILHGTPQEHRNMPLDDAIALVGRSFQKYVDGLREKANAAAASPPPSTVAPAAAPVRVFLPPSSEVAYLLNLLADNRALTVSELESVIKYLQERRDKLIDAESRPIITDDGYVKSSASYMKSPSVQRETTPAPAKEAVDQLKVQQELTNKILSIFNGAGGNIQGVPPASSVAVAAEPRGTPAPQTSAGSSGGSGANLINFDNPNVQAALDNLIQSSPSLLKNINTNAATSQPPVASSAAVSSSQGRGLVAGAAASAATSAPAPPPAGYPPPGPPPPSSRGGYPGGYPPPPMSGYGPPGAMGYGHPPGGAQY